jgi:hypothetical protein
MGRRARQRTASIADLAVTLLGLGGFLSFLAAARMSNANAPPFDLFAMLWFFSFGGIKLSLPWLLTRWRAANRNANSSKVRLNLPLREGRPNGEAG